jgi:hypothetical protein
MPRIKLFIIILIYAIIFIIFFEYLIPVQGVLYLI